MNLFITNSYTPINDAPVTAYFPMTVIRHTLLHIQTERIALANTALGALQNVFARLKVNVKTRAVERLIFSRVIDGVNFLTHN